VHKVNLRNKANKVNKENKVKIFVSDFRDDSSIDPDSFENVIFSYGMYKDESGQPEVSLKII
jgi:hypothetical protein